MVVISAVGGLRLQDLPAILAGDQPKRRSVVPLDMECPKVINEVDRPKTAVVEFRVFISRVDQADSTTHKFGCSKFGHDIPFVSEVDSNSSFDGAQHFIRKFLLSATVRFCGLDGICFCRPEARTSSAKWDPTGDFALASPVGEDIVAGLHFAR